MAVPDPPPPGRVLSPGANPPPPGRAPWLGRITLGEGPAGRAWLIGRAIWPAGRLTVGACMPAGRFMPPGLGRGPACGPGRAAAPCVGPKLGRFAAGRFAGGLGRAAGRWAGRFMAGELWGAEWPAGRPPPPPPPRGPKACGSDGKANIAPSAPRKKMRFMGRPPYLAAGLQIGRAHV